MKYKKKKKLAISFFFLKDFFFVGQAKKDKNRYEKQKKIKRRKTHNFYSNFYSNFYCNVKKKNMNF